MSLHMSLQKRILLICITVIALVLAGCANDNNAATDAEQAAATAVQEAEDSAEAAGEAISEAGEAAATEVVQEAEQAGEAAEDTATDVAQAAEEVAANAEATTEAIATEAAQEGAEAVATVEAGAEEAAEAVDIALVTDPAAYMEADELIGYNVVNAAGEGIGEISDVVIDLSTGKIVFVTLEFGGFLGINEELIPLSLSHLSRDVEQDVLVTDLSLTEEMLADITTYPTDWPDLRNDVWFDEADELLRQLSLDNTALMEANVSSLVLLTDLDGQNISDASGDVLGEIEDVLINLQSGKIVYTVMSFGGFLGLGEDYFAVPLKAFQVIKGADDGFVRELTLDITEEQLEAAPGYDFDAIDFTNPNWDDAVRQFWSDLGVEFATPKISIEADAADAEDGADVAVLHNVFLPDGATLSLRHALGKTVYGREGANLGTIQDLLIHLQTGEVVYLALVPTATTTDIETLIPVPAGVLLENENDEFVIQTSADVLAGAPVIAANEWPLIASNLTLEENIFGYWSGVSGAPLTPRSALPAPAPAGPVGTFRGLRMPLMSMSEFVGHPILEPENEEQVATITDAIYSAGQVRYAVVSLRDATAMADAEMDVTVEMTRSVEMTATTETEMTAPEKITATETITETVTAKITPPVVDEMQTAEQLISGTVLPLYLLIYNHEAQQFFVDVDQEKLIEASELTAEPLDLSVVGWEDRIFDYWDDTGFVVQSGVRMIASSLVLAKTLLGYPVIGTDGENVGAISDFILDADSGKVRYVAVEFGGFLGLGEQVFFLPLNQLTISTLNGRFVADITAEQLEGAPSYDAGNWPDLSVPDWDVDVRAFWGLDDPEVEPEVDVEVDTEETAEETADVVRFNDTGAAIRANNLLGWPLLGADDTEIGEVEDLLIDIFRARVLYAVVDTGGFLDLDNNEFLVPFTRFTRAAEQESFVIDVTLDRLENAPVFDRDLFVAGVIGPEFRQEVDGYWNVDLDVDSE